MSQDMVSSRRRGVPSTVLGQRGVAGVAAALSSVLSYLWQPSRAELSSFAQRRAELSVNY